jgi:hypothetical protein
MDPGEQKALADIDKYGCHVVHVAAEDELPPFSYSVGIQRSSGAPEVVVVGLKQPIAHFVVNEYNRRVQVGQSFHPGETYSGFLEGFLVGFELVEEEFYREHFGWNLWLYNGPSFKVLQVVYPTTNGVWPWNATDGFRTWQPLLTNRPVLPRTVGTAPSNSP